MKVSVISPEHVLFDGEADSVIAPAFDGEVGILAHHAPLVALLGEGTVRLKGGAGDGRRFTLKGGFLQVADDVVRIIAESASEADGSEHAAAKAV
jgi:F-type H+-transporting ATPase subunit epsilon